MNKREWNDPSWYRFERNTHLQPWHFEAHTTRADRIGDWALLAITIIATAVVGFLLWKGML